MSSHLVELVAHVHAPTAIQRRILAHADAIDSQWAELGWEEIDRRLDDVFRAALIPVRRRAVSTTDARRDG